MTAAPAAETDVASRLRTAIGRLSRRLRSTAAGSGLTPTQTSVLFTIVIRGPLGMAELAQHEDLNPTMLSRVIAGLCERGLVTRCADASDRRAGVVASTRAGAALRRRIQSERAQVLGRELDELAPAQRAALVAALPALEALVEQLQERRG